MKRIMILWILVYPLLPTLALADWLDNGTIISTNAKVAHVTWDNPTMSSASDGAGGAIIAWADDQGGDHTIQAQRIDGDGNPLWADVVTISVGGQSVGDEQTMVHVLPDSEGGAYISWVDIRPDDTILLTRIDRQGVLVWTPQVIEINEPVYEVSSLDMVADNQGGVFLFWLNHPAGLYEIYGQWVDAAGSKQWPTAGAPICTDPNFRSSVVAESMGSSVVVAWNDYRDGGGDSDVYAQRIQINQAGAAMPQWTTNGIPVSSGSSPVVDIDLIVNSDGGAQFGWRESTGIHSTRLDQGGSNVFGGVATVSAWGAVAGGARMISDGADGAIFAWNDQHNSVIDGIYAQRLSPNGQTLWSSGGVVVNESGGAVEVDGIVATDDGGAVITWSESGLIAAQRLSSYGTPVWAAGGVTVRSEVSSCENVHVIEDGVGGVLVGWSDWRSGALGLPYAQRIEFTSGAWGHPDAFIVSASDVPGDQGGYVKVNWNASDRDVLVSPDTITHYSVWRAVDPVSKNLAATSRLPIVDPMNVMSDHEEPVMFVEEKAGASWYWEWVGNQDAVRFSGYSFTAPTSFDSIPGNPALHAFLVLSHSADPTVFWESNVGAGYSVDNLAPSTPVAFTGHASFAPQGIALSWTPNVEADLSTYALYRGATPGFVPDISNLVVTLADTLYNDTSWTQGAGYHYKVSAFDIHGNESGHALVAPDAVTAVGDAPLAIRLHANHPNPFNPSTVLAFELGSAGPVTLRVYDLAGRVVRTLLDSDQVASGRHEVAWSGRDASGRTVAAGTYVARMESGGRSLTRMMSLVK